MKLTAGAVLRKLLLSWLCAAAVCWLQVPAEFRSLSSLGAVKAMSLPLLLGVTCFIFAVLLALGCLRNTAALERWGICGVFLVLSVLTLKVSFRWSMFGSCLLVLTVILRYSCKGWRGDKTGFLRCGERRKGFQWAVMGAAIAFFLLVSAWGLGRLYAFCAPTYDFGIFSQMFHSMRTTGGQITTLERETAISHFKVHVSPIYYLLLPFYCLVPHPGTLQVMQAAVMASAVIPAWKLGRLHGLSSGQSLIMCLLLLLYPAYAGGAGYDLHENCFLTPLLLWLLYCADQRKTVLTVVFALLVMTVKEDAAVYSAVTGLWLTARGFLYRDQREWRTGLGILAVSVLWFLAVTAWLGTFGDGVMTWRYANFICGETGSLGNVILTVLLCPMKVLWECTDPEKLGYIALSLMPLLGIPLLTRRYERFLLMIPWILVNLMPDYEYQHSIYFQYNFGSCAFLVYLAAVNLADVKDWFRRFSVLLVALGVSAGLFAVTVVPTAVSYPVASIQHFEHYGRIHAVLDTVPEEAAVAASTWYTAELFRREILYDLRYASVEQILSAEYVVVGLTDLCPACEGIGQGSGIENLISLLESRGYIPVAGVEKVMTVYRK